MKRLRAASVGVVLLLASAAGTAAAVGTESSPTSAGCIEIGSSGHQIWHGPAADGAGSALGDALQALANVNHDAIAGVALCSDYSGAAIFVADPSPTLLAQISEVGAKYPTAALHLKHVPAALTAQLAASRRVIALAEAKTSLSRVSPDMYTGGLRVAVQPDAWPASDQLQRDVVAAATSGGTVDIPVEFVGGSVGHNVTTRLADTQPYYGGDEIRGASGICSAGFPITVNGVHTMLTAGHCTDTSFTNNGHAFGTQYTTAYPGNADIYGDWKLLSGQTYGLRIFSGAVSSSSTLAVTGANWGARPNGQQMCTSGRTTGSVCRFVINGSYDVVLDNEGVWSNNILDMYHDSSGTGSSRDSNGFGPGDSGGSCYYTDGAGGVIAAGIVKGVNSAQGYFCTQLSGVRDWKSTATLG